MIITTYIVCHNLNTMYCCYCYNKLADYIIIII